MYPLLSGLTVIEASSFVASPTAGLYLAQMGATVIRVDQIGGGPDYNRWPQAGNGRSLYWENLNRAKLSVALDLGRAEGRAVLQRLVRSAGLFVTNFPVNGFLSHATLAAGREDLITVRVMGRADGGPALDYTVNAAVGFPDLTGVGPGPVNHVLPAWDLLTGAYAAFALLAALRQRDATGAGGEVCVPLADVAIGTVANLGMLAEVLTTGTDRERLGNTVYGAFGRDFVTRDARRLMLLALTPKQWRGLVEVLDLSKPVARIEEERKVSFASDEGLRFTHRDALFPLVEAAVASRDYVPLSQALETAGCCWGPYQTMREAAQDATLVRDNQMFGESHNPSGAHYPAAGSFATIPQLERGAPRSAPELGQDSDAVLGELLGASTSDLAEWRQQGIVG